MAKLTIPKNRNGIPFGAYVITRNPEGGLWCARVWGASSYGGTGTTMCEVYGFAQESGSVWTRDLRIVTKQEWCDVMRQNGYDPVNTKSYIEKLRQWDTLTPEQQEALRNK